VFLAWFLREVCSYRDAEHYGQYTHRESIARRNPAHQLTGLQSINLSTPFSILVNAIFNALFFGIPWTYLSHVKTASEYRGRLDNVKNNWDEYILRLVREYSHFLLIVSYLVRIFAIRLIQGIGYGAIIVSYGHII
jgi:hypothetical protein